MKNRYPRNMTSPSTSPLKSSGLCAINPCTTGAARSTCETAESGFSMQPSWYEKTSRLDKRHPRSLRATLGKPRRSLHEHSRKYTARAPLLSERRLMSPLWSILLIWERSFVATPTLRSLRRGSSTGSEDGGGGKRSARMGSSQTLLCLWRARWVRCGHPGMTVRPSHAEGLGMRCAGC